MKISISKDLVVGSLFLEALKKTIHGTHLNESGPLLVIHGVIFFINGLTNEVTGVITPISGVREPYL